MKTTIPKEKKQRLKNTTKNIDTRYSDSPVSVFIDKKEPSLTLVTGQKPLFAQCKFILDKRSTNLKDKQFSIDGSYTKQLPDYFASEQDIELNFQDSSAGSTFIELIQFAPNGEQATLRRCECNDAHKEHITYLENNNKLPTTTVSKSVIERIIYESTEHMPFELCEMNQEQQSIRVQRDGKVEDKHLPNDIKLPISMVMTPETTQQLSDLCDNTDGDEIEIAQQGDLLTFKADDGAVTCFVGGINELRAKSPEKTQTLRHVELSFYEFKAELGHCLKEYSVIKKANDALLYLDDKKAAIAVFTQPYEFVRPISTSKVSGKKNKYSLYRFSPKDLLDIKIKDLNGANSTRLDIIKYPNGELKLGVYSSSKDKLPYRSIPIENDESQLSKVLVMLESLEKIEVTSQHKKQEVQEDLFASGMYDGDDEY